VARLRSRSLWCGRPARTGRPGAARYRSGRPHRDPQPKRLQFVSPAKPARRSLLLKLIDANLREVATPGPISLMRADAHLFRFELGAQAMISRQDCIAPCGLDEEEIAAISEHEHVPETAAAALANHLLQQPLGGQAIRKMIIDDIRKALDNRRVAHAA
jgi:hypothetical protein